MGIKGGREVKKIIIMGIILLIAGVSNGADDLSITESVFSETSYCVGDEFYGASKQTIYQGGDKNGNAYEATIKRYEVIRATYIGLLNNSLQILLEEFAIINAINNNTSKVMPDLSDANSKKRVLFIPLSPNKQGLLRIVKEFGVLESNNGNSALNSKHRVRHQRDLLLTIVNEFGCFEKSEYKEKPKKENF